MTLTTKQAAAYLGVTVGTIRCWRNTAARANSLPFHREHYARTTYQLADLKAFKRQHRIRKRPPKVYRRLPSHPPDTEFCTREAARLLNVSPKTMKVWRCIGRGPTHQRSDSGQIIYRFDALLAWNVARRARANNGA